MRSAYDALNAVGGYVRINKVVIANVSEGTFVALLKFVVIKEQKISPSDH